MKFIKSALSEIGHRSLAHWKTSLIGAVEGSGITLAGLLTGDPKLVSASIGTGLYLFIKGIISKDGAK